MPFNYMEVMAMSGGLLDLYGEELRRAEENAAMAQSYMWAVYGDDLIGVPEVEPEPPSMKIDRTPSPWWKRIYE